jgi:hypothetical protein
MSNYINDIKGILAAARQNAYSAVNVAMVEAYWQIGKRIVEQEQHGKDRAAYGESILKELSKALTAEFGRGFSYANLRNFRQFYLTYPDPDICYTLCSKLTWSHNRLIKLTHQDIGQMDMYRRMFDDLKKPEGDNATIGIILCTEKSETVVKYSVINDNPKLFATKYMPYLPTESELIAEIEREKRKLNLFREQEVAARPRLPSAG